MSVFDAFDMAMQAALELSLAKVFVALVVFSFICLWAMVWSAWQRHVTGAAILRSGRRSGRSRKLPR